METEHAIEHQEVSEVVQEIKMLEGIARKKLGRDGYADRQVAFAQRLREKYPDYQRWEAYHALAGSTVNPEIVDEPIVGDFPGEDSVVLFLQSLVY